MNEIFSLGSTISQKIIKYKYLSISYKKSNIKSKTDLINLLFVFHNTVNKRARAPAFRYENLGYYNTKNVFETYNLFARNFNTRGNMKLINESFHRNMMLSSLRNWMVTNMSHFEL